MKEIRVKMEDIKKLNGIYRYKKYQIKNKIIYSEINRLDVAE